MASKHVSNREAAPHVTSEHTKFIFIPGEKGQVGEDLQKVRSASAAARKVLQLNENTEMPLKWCGWKQSQLWPHLGFPLAG